MPTKKFQKEMNSGTASLVLLSVLSQSEDPMYGYQIGKMLNKNRDIALRMKQGALYPVLRSLEKNALLSSQVEPSVSGPPRRYYQITTEGDETLKEWLEIWQEMKSFVDKTLEGESHV
ncbi:MAG: PadR family transcriptional regulator [Anaerolineae bacterium]|jgi:PadR family transcriptional regulator, regulatory protein PadR|nr:PadR family transcriptional regulator [Anaerolineae bacterium]MBT7075005.1 PadR family transcriptional regulator [Anaerolineae bacterium]MBT7782530.1 PadR family transcriptional regulator [Anaerolineae bacterium]